MTGTWAAVETYLDDHLGADDEALRRCLTTARAAGLPEIEVPQQLGGLLALLCRVAGATRVLEVGTLAGYSTLHLARAVGPTGQVTTLELDPDRAAIAEANLSRAGVGDRVQVLPGPADETLRALVAADAPLYDLVLIDADKRSNVAYLDLALQLAHPGTLVVVDNVVRQGRVADPACDDPDVVGSRAVIEHVGAHPRLDACAIQTVGAKGHDGFLLALVR